MTGICYAIAMDIRTCGLSAFSYQVGLRLISIASTVHLAVKAYLLQKQDKAAFVEQSKIRALREKSNLFKVVYIIFPIFLWEIIDSIFFELLSGLVTILTTYPFFSARKMSTQKKIMSLGFGQIMAVLLLLVFAVTALEVGSEPSPSTQSSIFLRTAR